MRELHVAFDTGEHEGLRDTAAGDGIAQRARDRLLSDDVIEPLRTPLACENLVAHSENPNPKSQIPNPKKSPNRLVGIWVLGFGFWDF